MTGDDSKAEAGPLADEVNEGTPQNVADVVHEAIDVGRFGKARRPLAVLSREIGYNSCPEADAAESVSGCLVNPPSLAGR
jgi:hypothetical protein